MEKSKFSIISLHIKMSFARKQVRKPTKSTNFLHNFNNLAHSVHLKSAISVIPNETVTPRRRSPTILTLVYSSFWHQHPLHTTFNTFTLILQLCNNSQPQFFFFPTSIAFILILNPRRECPEDCPGYVCLYVGMSVYIPYNFSFILQTIKKGINIHQVNTPFRSI